MHICLPTCRIKRVVLYLSGINKLSLLAFCSKYNKLSDIGHQILYNTKDIK